MPLISSGLTDIGQKRKTNQDSIYLGPEEKLFIVADGMGGHLGGDMASQMAVTIVPQIVKDNLNSNPSDLCAQSIQYANKLIREKGQEEENLKGMGTTAVMCYFKGSTMYLANVGDSRAYLFSSGDLYQLSRDHSLIQEKINMGIYTRDQAKKDPAKNVLIRTVGFEAEVEVDVYTYKVRQHDLFLLCSDGLHGKVSDPDLQYIINKRIFDQEVTQESMDQTVRELVDLANQNGGQDNISTILIYAK